MEGRMNILLLGAGTQGLAIVKGLAKAGFDISMLIDEDGNYGDKSRYVSKKFFCHSNVGTPEHLNEIKSLLKREKFDVVIPMGDADAEFLSKNQEVLSKWVSFVIPSYETFMKGYDKNKLMALCAQKGYPHPQTIDLSKVNVSGNDALRQFPYPAILKPNCTTGGRGMRVVESYEEMLAAYPTLHEQFGDYHLQRFIRAGGRQMKIQVCVDDAGKMIAHSAMQKVRWYPVKGGSSCCSISIEEEKMTAICHRILCDLGWEGFADFDLIEDPETNELLIMEINPRLPACIGAAIHSGVDWGRIIVDQALGQEQKTYKYKTGIILRHLGFDILWFLKSPNRYKTCPSWFHFWGKNIFYQDMDGWMDPKPFLVGTYHNIKKLFDPSFKKAKQTGW